MVFYIAEQIKVANISTGKKKIEDDKRCFEMILNLWKQNSSFPDGHRPFENFDTIFKVLERLDPDNKSPYYFSDKLLSDSPKEKPEELTKWLELALATDEAVRVWMEYIFQQAAKSISNSKTIEWLNNSTGVLDEIDYTAIINILENDIVDDKTSVESLIKKKNNLLKSRISKLKTFVKFNKDLLKLFQQELITLNSEDNNKEIEKKGR